MLQLKGLRKRYPGEAEPAVDGVDLEIAAGEMVAVLGRSGAGKSTLIRCINRLVEPDAGVIRWNGSPVTGVSPRRLREIRSEIGMIFQHFHLLPRLNVLTNVIAGRFAAIPRWRSLLAAFTGEQRAAALEALRRVGLEHLASRRVEELSGGQRQRVAIARVLMQQPKLLLGDEPVSSLDPVTAERIMMFVAALHRDRGLTVILNLHDVSLARRYAQRVVGLARGRIVYDGPPEGLGEAELLRIYPPDEEADTKP